MVDTEEILQRLVIAKQVEAGASASDDGYWQRHSLTTAKIAAESIDALRLDMRLILHHATVGSLTKDGYKNAIEQIREIAQRAIDRHNNMRS